LNMPALTNLEPHSSMFVSEPETSYFSETDWRNNTFKRVVAKTGSERDRADDHIELTRKYVRDIHTQAHVSRDSSILANEERLADTQEVTAELEDAINYVEQLLDDWETFKGTIEGRRAIWAAFLELAHTRVVKRQDRGNRERAHDKCEKALQSELWIRERSNRDFSMAFCSKDDVFNELRMLLEKMLTDFDSKTQTIQTEEKCLKVNQQIDRNPLPESEHEAESRAYTPSDRTLDEEDDWRRETMRCVHRSKRIADEIREFIEFLSNLMDQLDEKMDGLQSFSEAELDAKLSEQQEMESDMMTALEDMQNTIDTLKEERRILEGEIGEIQQQLDIAMESMEIRTRRGQNDRIMDRSKESLTVEITQMKRSLQQLRRRVERKIRELVNCQEDHDKHSALLETKRDTMRIDTECRQLQAAVPEE